MRPKTGTALVFNTFWEAFEHSETSQTEGVLLQGFEFCQEGQEV